MKLIDLVEQHVPLWLEQSLFELHVEGAANVGVVVHEIVSLRVPFWRTGAIPANSADQHWNYAAEVPAIILAQQVSFCH